MFSLGVQFNMLLWDKRNLFFVSMENSYVAVPIIDSLML